MGGETALAVVLAALPVLTCVVVFAQLATRRKKADEALQAAVKAASKVSSAPPAQHV